MKKTKAKVAPPMSLNQLGKEVVAYCETASKEDTDYFIEEFEEMIAMLENWKTKNPEVPAKKAS